MKINWLVILAMLLIASPIFFTWHAELLQAGIKTGNHTFTNGVLSCDGEIIYHAWLYVTLSVCFYTAYLILTGKLKLAGGRSK